MSYSDILSGHDPWEDQAKDSAQFKDSYISWKKQSTRITIEVWVLILRAGYFALVAIAEKNDLYNWLKKVHICVCQKYEQNLKTNSLLGKKLHQL
jgi:hypothetical protein